MMAQYAVAQDNTIALTIDQHQRWYYEGATLDNATFILSDARTRFVFVSVELRPGNHMPDPCSLWLRTTRHDSSHVRPLPPAHPLELAYNGLGWTLGEGGGGIPLPHPSSCRGRAYHLWAGPVTWMARVPTFKIKYGGAAGRFDPW